MVFRTDNYIYCFLKDKTNQGILTDEPGLLNKFVATGWYQLHACHVRHWQDHNQER